MAESPLPPALRQRFAPALAATGPARFTLGAERLDAALGGGLERGRLHELWPARAADGPSACGVATMLALRAAGAAGTILWIAEQARHARGHVYAPGLAELGASPARFLFVDVADTRTLLRAAGEVVRSPAPAAVVIAPAGAAALLDLTASRRLTLFAERSGTTAILLRAADPARPSAAATRWRVAAAPSIALEADAPGHPAFTLDLVRRRGGPPSEGWHLEWRRDAGGFAPLPGRVPAVADGGRVAA